MTQTSFGFQWTGLSLAISMVALVSVCCLSWLAWRRSGYRPAVLGLECLRVLLVAFAVFLLNQPESIEEFRPTEKPTVVVLGDQSLSMDTQDVGFGESESTPLLTRRRAIEPVLDAANWSDVAESMEVVITPFAVGQQGAESNLYEALDKARQEHEHLRAVVLASDGDWNAGKPPVQAAMRLRLEQIPILGWP